MCFLKYSCIGILHFAFKTKVDLHIKFNNLKQLHIRFTMVSESRYTDVSRYRITDFIQSLQHPKHAAMQAEQHPKKMDAPIRM